MSDTDLNETGLEAAAKAVGTFEGAALYNHIKSAIRAYKAAEGVGPVEVKPLEWCETIYSPELRGGQHSYAGSIFEVNYKSWGDGTWSGPGGHNNRSDGTLETGKAAAQADYDARIRSVLSAPQPSQSRDEVVEASRFLLERLDDFDSESDVDLYRQFAGHVYPAMGRLRLALSASPQREGWRDINVNHEVEVKLTPFGLEHMRKRHAQLNASVNGSLGPFTKPKTDAEGWSRWQLWCLMQEFGDVINNGMTVPFETTIRVCLPTPSKEAP